MKARWLEKPQFSLTQLHSHIEMQATFTKGHAIFDSEKKKESDAVPKKMATSIFRAIFGDPLSVDRYRGRGWLTSSLVNMYVYVYLE